MNIICSIKGPLYKGHFGTLIPVLITVVTSIQRSLNTLQYYTGTQNGVLIAEVPTFQRFVIQRSHCMYFVHIMHSVYTVYSLYTVCGVYDVHRVYNVCTVYSVHIVLHSVYCVHEVFAHFWALVSSFTIS